MKRLEARLKRATQNAGIGRRCAYCTLVLRTNFSIRGVDWKKADDAAETLMVKCVFCGTECRARIPDGWPEWKRDVVRLSHTYKEREFYTDKKAAAVRMFQSYMSSRAKAAEEANEKLKMAIQRLNPDPDFRPPVGSYGNGGAGYHRNEPTTKAGKLRAALLEEYGNDVRKLRGRMVKKYGRRFPELDTLVHDLTHSFFTYSDYRPLDIEADDYLKMLNAWVVIESAIWGEPLAHTVAEIAEHRRLLTLFAEGIVEKKQREERERAERERERLERLEAARAPVPRVELVSAPASNDGADSLTGSDDPAEWIKKWQSPTVPDNRQTYQGFETMPTRVEPIIVPDVPPPMPSVRRYAPNTKPVEQNRYRRYWKPPGVE